MKQCQQLLFQIEHSRSYYSRATTKSSHGFSLLEKHNTYLTTKDPTKHKNTKDRDKDILSENYGNNNGLHSDRSKILFYIYINIDVASLIGMTRLTADFINSVSDCYIFPPVCSHLLMVCFIISSFWLDSYTS